MKLERSGLLVVSSLAGMLLFGCGSDQSRTKLVAPNDMPRFVFEDRASELRVKGSNDAGKVFDVAQEALFEMVAAREGSPLKARFTADVDGGSSMHWTWPFCFLLNAPDLFLFSFSCTDTTYSAKVHLKLQTTRGLWVGDGSSSHGTSGQSDAVWLATVHDAFQDAFINAKMTDAAEGQAK